MPSLFQELEILDRPFVPLKISIRGRELEVEARLPSAQEQDAIDAFYMDAYAKAIAEKLEVRPGHKTSERDSLRLIYESRPKSDIIEQLIPTRSTDIQIRAFELAGIDRDEELKILTRLVVEDEPAAEIRAKKLDESLADTQPIAVKEIEAEYESKSLDELARLMADVNINVKARNIASQARDADVLYHSIYGKDLDRRLFDSPEEVLSELRPETIAEINRAIRQALKDSEDLPFVSPDDKELDGQPSSSNDLAADTKIGGRRTKTTRESSKQSTTPAS